MSRPGTPVVVWTSKDGHCRIVTIEKEVHDDELIGKLLAYTEVAVEEISGYSLMGEPIWKRTGRHHGDDALPNEYLRQILTQFKVCTVAG